jgi:serine/threonine protein kinase
MDTIRLQISVLGSRPPEELSYIRSDQALQFLAGLPPCVKVPWESLFPTASDKALDLLERLLQFLPSKRITVDDAIAHAYFDSVRSQYVDPDPVLAHGPGAFDFSFEYDQTLNEADFKRLIVDEVISFRAEKVLSRRFRGEKDVSSETKSTEVTSSGHGNQSNQPIGNDHKLQSHRVLDKQSNGNLIEHNENEICQGTHDVLMNRANGVRTTTHRNARDEYKFSRNIMRGSVTER